jgi:hypothetical protein
MFGQTMKMMFGAIAVLVAMTANPAAAESDFLSSGNYYLPFCRSFVAKQLPKDANAAAGQGQCVGIVDALTLVSSFLMPELAAKWRSCTPNSVTHGQSVAVVVHWLDQHPQRWNEDFQFLALEALREAWPCK